jgi:riboflavin kinase/FMN adenylyltransferase
MHTVDFGGLRVSSSAVRDALAAGNIEHAEQLLGRAFVIAGRVMDGKKLGRTIGFPTANIQVRRKRLPLSGCFRRHGFRHRRAAAARRRQHRRASDCGGRPQAGARSPLLDFDRDIYGMHVDVNFLHKLRDEAKFDSLDALKAQIARDVVAVRAYFESRQDPWLTLKKRPITARH